MSKFDKPEFDERLSQLNDAWKAILLLQSRLVADLEERAEAKKVVEPSTFHVLAILMKCGGKARFKYLTQHVLIRRAGLSRLLARLEKERLVRRERCEDDDRGVDIALTDIGEKAFMAAFPVYSDRLKERLGNHLDADSVRQLTEILGRVLKANGWAPPVISNVSK
ncbi:MAG TPA: MarR family winged helix-turn-helix transcriptional regulator [Oculatellaceae cyanobacterium]